MLRWLLNKLTLAQVDELRLENQKLKLRMENLEEQFKKTRAYVGYHGKKRDPDTEEPAEAKIKMTPELVDFINGLPEWDRNEVMAKLNNKVHD